MQLNPKLFEGEKLRSDVRAKFGQIVRAFKEFLDEQGIKLNIAGVHLVGSNADFNYRDDSDVDIHIVSDFSSINHDVNLVQMLLNDEKAKFNRTYNMKIRGLPVEVSVEDVGAGTISNGIYDVAENKWLKVPKKETPPEVIINNEVQGWVDAVDALLDSEDLNISSLQGLINSIYMLRKNALQAEGQYSKGNLIFKQLRSNGVLSKLSDRRTEMVSADLSINESFSKWMENLLKED